MFFSVSKTTTVTVEKVCFEWGAFYLLIGNYFATQNIGGA